MLRAKIFQSNKKWLYSFVWGVWECVCACVCVCVCLCTSIHACVFYTSDAGACVCVRVYVEAWGWCWAPSSAILRLLSLSRGIPLSLTVVFPARLAARNLGDPLVSASPACTLPHLACYTGPGVGTLIFVVSEQAGLTTLHCSNSVHDLY